MIDGCGCCECQPNIDKLDQRNFTLDSNNVWQNITKVVFQSIDDLKPSCELLKISRIGKGNKMSSNDGLKVRVKCSECGSQFMTFSEFIKQNASGKEYRLFTHTTLKKYIAHSCEGILYQISKLITFINFISHYYF